MTAEKPEPDERPDAALAPERREARGNVRESLIQAALRMVQEEGVDAISVREVARRAGVSSGAPFRHFKDRNALLVAIAEDGLRRVEEASEAARASAGEDPVAQLQAYGVVVVRFAAENPAHYRVMHLPDLPPSPEMQRLLDRKRVRMRELIEAGQRQGLIREGDPDVISLACVATVYGLSRFFVDGLACCPVDPRACADLPAEKLTDAMVCLLGEGLVTARYWETVGRERPRFSDCLR